ncbi:MAG: winged helix-turn-helix transcriptional regulator [Natronohydrobacter sp.]|nr:winged helix-turn-helix transcriptional regulator [Natronohydrobacter sp.]
MSDQNAAKDTDIADLIVHLARMGQSCGHAEGTPALTAAQWTALRYFARANRFSRTPSAFSEFHATTRGTASQTVKSLVAMGLLARHSHDSDGRSTLIEVTEAGQAQLRRDPLRDLRRVLGALPETSRAALTNALSQAIADLARVRAAPIFGTCGDCNHLDSKSSYCHCTHSLLTLPEMQAICVDFQPARVPGQS